MTKEMIFNCNDCEARIAILDARRLVNLYVERWDEHSIAGNIYVGRVARVLPGMQAAFVDVGLDRTAFLYVADASIENPEDTYLLPGEEDENGLKDLGGSSPVLSIENILREGQEILVQASKEPLGTKGARVTTYISLAGRNLVAMPGASQVGVSRKIKDEAERERLRLIIEEARPPDFGFIARTVSEGRGADEIRRDIRHLVRLWETIQHKRSLVGVPGLVHRELNMVLRAVRDFYTEDMDRIIIDSKSEYDRIEEYMKEFMPALSCRLELYEDEEPIFDFFGIEVDVEKLFDKKVWLKSGGFIVIEETEALCSIDVNTGRYVGKRTLEETILKTNLEAARQIAHQLRVRNIGGIIIIDFIDMEDERSRELVYSALAAELERDRSRTSIQKISELGLIEMTRQRQRRSLSRIMCESCPYCSGRGVIKSKTTIYYEILRELKRAAVRGAGGTICVLLNPDVAGLFTEGRKKLLDRLEQRYNKKIILQTDNRLFQDTYEIIPMQ
ncbi:MAG: Rne/Rng family ribonuclease [Syntrophales bacterium]|jgi:ribonuclease G|nr:Rne/Rng family ribonuclease [Syntrophales bacterium]MCK9527828.1 Rne/Rng family ribonuclease [Syntrophales bacterium]MDX9922075.1 Rne/Rng family ribonuclease [Syntrophales bacterium]